MSYSEISCSSCNFIFNDNQLYNLHLKTCASNKNNDPKNKYYCPICNRQFRLLSNLLRHNETRKHQELLEWHVNKMSSGPNTNNVKNISVNLTDEELESTSRKSQSKTFDLDLDLDLFIDEKANITTTLEPEDPFLANLQNTYSQQNIQQNPPFESHSQIQLNIEPQIEEPDNFLQNLIKEREKAFASFTNTSTNTSHTSHTSRKDDKDSKEKPKNTKVVGFTIQEDDAVNLRSEIEKAKCQLGGIHFYTENTQKTEKTEKTEIKDEAEDEYEDALLNNIQSLRTSKMNNLSAKLDASKKINSESKTAEEYPSSYHNLPLWKNLQVIVKNSQAPKLLVSILINTPLNDYPKICTFVYFSKELKENKSLKINMVRAMIEVKKHLNQLFNKRQTVWNSKHIPLTLALMNKWKLEDFLKTLL
jgi:hypothetical protein